MEKITKEARQDLIDKGADADAIDAYIELGIGNEDLSDFEESYVGKYDNDKDFAQEMAEETGAVDFKNLSWPQYCIDWEWASRELMMGYSEQDGHYFRNL